MRHESIGISGMTCAACAKRIERATGKLDGVTSAAVNFATEKLTVEYDENVIQVGAISDTIAKIGYGVVEGRKNGEVTIPIAGMTCAACARRIEKALGKSAGVLSASVNFATERATVVYDLNAIKLSGIKDAISKAGYTPLDAERKGAVDEDRIRKEREINSLKRKFTVSAVFGIPLLYIAMGSMIWWWPFPIPRLLYPMQYPLNYAIVQIILTVPIVIAGRRFYSVGFRSLVQGSPNMDSLIAIGTSAALVYSFYSTYQILAGNFGAVEGLYFESAGVIITLILLGKYLEAVSKGKTSEAIKKLMGLAPKTAIIIQDGKEMEIPIDEVEIGHVILVKPGGKIPVDGVIADGHSAVDESMLTGESIPIDKKPGDKVFAATINKNGVLRFEATKVGSDTALAQIIKLVEDAQGSKAPIAAMADIVSGYFVPVVCVIAVIAATAWYFLGTPPAGWTHVQFALTIFIAILIIACPCALGLATPTAIMVGTGKGAENGILFKGGEALETTHKLNAIVFDKTGTLTEGHPEVTDIVVAGSSGIRDEKHLLQITASAEKSSEHPLGEAIVRKAETEGVDFLEVEGFQALTGLGIEASVGGSVFCIGNRKLMAERGILLGELEGESDRLAEEGKTPMYVVLEDKLVGIIAVADVLKKSSAEAIKSLKAMGVKVAMITGDNKKTAGAIARQVGIDIVLAEVLPQDKSNEVKKLQSEGLRVAMVGDGINDAPALAQADIGIAIGSGTDVAMESADIVLMKSDLMDVPTAIALSRATIRNIKQNLFWAFAYNTAGIPVAAGVLHIFGGPLLNPIFAAAAMSLSSVSVLTNALRLRRFEANRVSN
ncbi:MAG: heavy metal translocating P-type ATPase [Synergistaceae bacterium]|jgi:Cu+-exporting ATPase|nr:heavy metal translocating P-type ATPase [Synergistaceae bacterium]